MSETSSQEFAAVAQRVADRLDEVVEAMLDRVWANPALSEWTRDETREAAREIARASIAREIDALTRGMLPEEPPEEDLAAARAAVEYGAPASVVLHCYRAGQAALLDAWVDAGGTTELKEASDFMTRYVDRCAAWVEAEHMREHERRIRSEEQRRMNLVRDLLDGLTADAVDLGHELDADHLAVIAWGRHAEAAVRELADRLGAESLVLSVDPQTAWGWVSTSDEAEDLTPPEGTRMAVGGPAGGLDGFRRAYSEARRAHDVADFHPGAVIRYRDVALEALAGADERRARDFVEHELGPLLGNRTRERTLRDTLGAYFAAGQNAVAAGAALGVHDRTVANRLRSAERALGTPIAARRAELEVALRLCRLLDQPRR